jgi:phosphoglycolate phosphatase
VVFDLDGTLIDSYRAITASVNHARAAFEMAPMSEPVVRRHVGRGLEALMADVLEDPGRVPEGVRLFRDRYAEVYRSQTDLLPAAMRTVRELHRRGYPMAVASNKPARFGEAILRDLGLLPYLNAVQGPDRAGRAKPDPTMIRLCLGSMAVVPREAVYVGDMVVDVQSAARAEIPVVLVAGGSSDESELAGTGELVLRRLDTLLDLLPPLPARGRAFPDAASERRSG